MMSERILCVDDDANVLASYQRQLRKEFEIDTALGAEPGLEAVRTRAPYAVVVSDMRMPGMDGIQFLARVCRVAPDSVRIMLTGFADQHTAIEAVNEGNIFRFLTKPCAPETLTKALAAGIAQHRLVIAERELLEQTLRGSVEVLTDLLGLVNPTAFSRSSRIRHLVRQMSMQLHLCDVWKFEMAAMLSQIGCVTFPPEILDAVYTGAQLPPEQERDFARHPAVARALLAKIPRLEQVAEMIARQHDVPEVSKPPVPPRDRDAVTVGAQILKTALDFDRLITGGMARQLAVKQLRERADQYDPVITASLEHVELCKIESETRVVETSALETHMILDEDVRSQSGMLLVTKGQEVTYPLLERLRNFALNNAIPPRLRVRLPGRSTETAPAVASTP
jgi:response regulator RpfG family c-di-GMP phosphodiesterase